MHNSIVTMIVSDNIFWRILRSLQFHRLLRKLKGASKSTGNVVTEHAFSGIPSVSDKQLESRYKLAWKRLHEMGVKPGDYLEFCKTRGTAIAGMHRVVNSLKLNNVRLISFEIAKPVDPRAISSHESPPRREEFEMGERNALRTDGHISNDGYLITAPFDEVARAGTAKKVDIKKCSVAMIDCTSHEATRSALNFVAPLILDHTMIFLHNGSDETDFGEHLAYSEFLKEHDYLKSVFFRDYKPCGKIFCVTSMKVD